MLRENKQIVHIDLSNNNFDLEESIKISQALQVNNSIFGFHFAGNYGYVDDLGRLIVDENSNKQQSKEIKNHKIEGVKKNMKINRSFGEVIKDSCWICEGWQQTDLSWTYGISGN